MAIRSIFWSKYRGLLVGVLLAGSVLMGAEGGYITFLSAEWEHYRRIIIDGVGDRRVEVRLDSLGAAEVRVWDVTPDSYVGRREYEHGYLVPVNIRVDFLRKNQMLIKITGSRFAEVVRYQVVDSDIYVIDLYTQPLPQESFFREQTISAHWPTGPFEPDITPSGEPTEPSQATLLSRFRIPQEWVQKLAPYRNLFRRAVVWAGSISGVLIITGWPLIWLRQRRKTGHAADTSSETRISDGDAQLVNTEGRIRHMMGQNDALSYEEATLLSELEQDKTVAALPR